MAYTSHVVSEQSFRCLCRPVVFQEPERLVHPPSWLEHTPFAFWIVDALRPATFVELGCQSGNSYASFAQAVQYLGLSTACYGVDTWQGDPQAGFFGESVFEDWSAYHDQRFSSFSRLVRSTFDEALEHFSSGSIDLLHIDGYHTFEAVSHDFEAWRPKLSERGVVLCHDINVHEKGFGAWRLWERLRDKYPSFEFRHGHGLGVLGIGNDLPEAVRWLLFLSSEDPESVTNVRLFFARLGAAVLGRYTSAEGRRTLRDELAARDGRLEQATGEVERLRTHVSESERTLAAVQAELSQVAEARATSDALLGTRATEVEELRSEAASLQARVSALSQDLENRTDHLARANDDVAELNRRLAESQRCLASAEARATDLRDALMRAEVTLVARDADAGQLSSDLRVRDRQIASLARELDAIVRARRADQTVFRRLDREATALLERLHREANERFEEIARRKHLDTVLAWSRAQIATLATRPSWTTIPGLSAALRWAIRRPGTLRHVLKIAATPSRLRDFAVIHASGLFDEPYYLAHNPGVSVAGIPPLVHFVLTGGRAGDPHPLFSTDFYISQVRDLADSSQNPLQHFLEHGWRMGYSPHAAFDVGEYLARHPDVRAAGENPLVHYVRQGPATPPHAPTAFPTRPRHERLVDTRRVELSACSLAARDENPPTIVVVSHVGSWRPKAGNEYRMQRMLRWYRKRGYRVVSIVAPLPGEEVPREGIEETAAALGNVIQVHRDGTVEYVLKDVPDVVASLNGTFTPSFADLLREDAGAGPRERELLILERTFCHDAVISTVLHLQRSLGPHILQVEYIWMTRLLPLVHGHVLKVVDTIDVLSNNKQKVGLFDVRDIVVEPHEEAEHLRRADLVIAIQNEERAALRQLAPSIPVITAGVDFDLAGDGRPAAERRILIVGSNNPRNRKGLQDFLRLAWPRIRERVPDAEFLVVGSVAEVLDGREIPGVRVTGRVDDLTTVYQQAAVVINPAVAGTGVKVKTLEALCHLRPVVTWPSGVEGLDPALAALCRTASDWYEFSERVVDVLTRSPLGGLTAEDRDVIATLVAPEHVYATVDSAYREFFEQHRAAAAPRQLTGRAGA